MIKNNTAGRRLGVFLISDWMYGQVLFLNPYQRHVPFAVLRLSLNIYANPTRRKGIKREANSWDLYLIVHETTLIYISH
ncbi:hypothetical protein PUN28_003084 [Cardiocondyla obscurior]|uniref:Uncharacterized protein n=1 Tax=Cardiocondyla obscurior TaxID=286306 RepID=A0AAW2GJY6_9HYME